MKSTDFMLHISLWIALGLVVLILVYCLRRLRLMAAEKKLVETELRKVNERFDNLQLEAFEAKLSPHLFKNILNTIQSHAYQSYHAIDKLSNVLDYMLYESRNKYVSPKEEIEFALNLIEINKIKISPLFEIKVKQKIKDNEPLFDQRLMAPLITVDLIENAFKHADLRSPDAFITITFEFSNSKFYLTVSNKISSKSSLQKDRSGLGNQSLEHRLQMIYQENYQLERFVEGDVYVAHLKINLLEHKAKMLAIR